jgi:hypothetical protein
MPEQGDQPNVYHAEGGGNAGNWILLALAIIFVGGAVFFGYDMHNKVTKLTDDQTASQQQIANLTKRMQSAEADSEALGEKIGLTKKEMVARAAELQRMQTASAAKLAQQEKQDVNAIGTEVGGVKNDVGGVKTDLGTTKASLEETKAQLQHTIGDLGVQSGLIANTRGDLETLKHKGDRQYYEFTLLKGAKPQAISTVTLQLRKTDPKRGKYTLNVTSDDKSIEKKDRTQSEPVQFYTGREHMLFELVVWTVDKNKITGYLSTPKNAPVPITATPQ